MVTCEMVICHLTSETASCTTVDGRCRMHISHLSSLILKTVSRCRMRDDHPRYPASPRWRVAHHARLRQRACACSPYPRRSEMASGPPPAWVIVKLRECVGLGDTNGMIVERLAALHFTCTDRQVKRWRKTNKIVWKWSGTDAELDQVIMRT